jgi:regulator of sirC expression with transglutaminase-like and TPR domain
MREIRRQLVTIEGFAGNVVGYGDARNSFLNEVIERKLGIPITLSVLYIELGERLGVPVRGISFPGHFLVRFGEDPERLVLDPFFDGAELDEEELLGRMRRFVPDEGSARTYLAQVLRGAPKTEVVARMLRNLKQIYSEGGQIEAALEAADRIVAVTPRSPAALRDRGDLYARLDCPHAAAEDYASCLALDPGSPDAAELQARIAELRRAAPRIN